MFLGDFITSCSQFFLDLLFEGLLAHAILEYLKRNTKYFINSDSCSAFEKSLRARLVKVKSVQILYLLSDLEVFQ